MNFSVYKKFPFNALKEAPNYRRTSFAVNSPHELDILFSTILASEEFVAGEKSSYFYKEQSLGLSPYFLDWRLFFYDDLSPIKESNFPDTEILFLFWQIVLSKAANNFYWKTFPSLSTSFEDMQRFITHELSLFHSEAFAFLLPAGRELGDDSWVSKYNLWNQLTCKFLIWQFKKDFEARIGKPKPFMQIDKDVVSKKIPSKPWPFPSDNPYKDAEVNEMDFFIKLSDKKALNFEKV